MRVRLVMELEDVPGALVKALEPISRYGANIQSVVHQREKKTSLGRVPITVILEVGDRQRLNKMLAILKKSGIRITLVGEKEGVVKLVVLLVGHIIHTDIRSTIDSINSLSGVRVSKLRLAMGDAGKESAASLTIAADNEKRAGAALKRLSDISARKKLLMINSVGGL